MPTRQKKKKDFSEIALGVVEAAIQSPLMLPPSPLPKNPAPIAFDRFAASKGGKAGAKKFSAKRRSQITKKAARTRLGK